MKRLLLLVFLVDFPDVLHAQWWFRIREGYHPTKDSLCWMVGRENDVDFFFDLSTPEEIIFQFGMPSHVKLSTVVGDSAWLTFKDGYVLRLRNCVNSQPKRSRFKMFGHYVPEFEYDFFVFTAPIRREDLTKLATKKLRSFVIHLHAPGVNLATLFQAPRNVFIPKRFRFDMTNRRVEVSATKPLRFTSDLRTFKRTARRAERWLQNVPHPSQPAIPNATATSR